jgi:hypothetical protein
MYWFVLKIDPTTPKALANVSAGLERVRVENRSHYAEGVR